MVDTGIRGGLRLESGGMWSSRLRVKKNQTAEEGYEVASDARHMVMLSIGMNRPIRHFGYI